MNVSFVVAAAFLASAVEMVEALTIVLAAGATRGWRSALLGSAAATACLALAVALVGPALVRFPIDLLRLVVGGLLLMFGLQWLRKAVLRAGGYVPLHDEDAIYRRETGQARAAEGGGAPGANGADGGARGGTDWCGFTLSFKGVFLEGLEVAFIVITFGTAPGGITWAALGAGIAFVVVGTAGVLLRRPLSAVPENTLKFAVGALLTTFGVFWGAEGAGAAWPAGDAALPAVLAAVLLASLGCVAWLRRLGPTLTPSPAGPRRARE